MNRRLVLLTACAATLFASQSWASIQDSLSWINEFHYDNAGTDEGEFVEVVVHNSHNLSDLVLDLYNGSNGEVYNEWHLDEDDFAGGDAFGDYQIFYIELPTNGIQNGAPDGLALSHTTLGVLQFLSYEGTPFIATDGPAKDLTSTDIGVKETGSTPIGHSLQLTGTGLTYFDFHNSDTPTGWSDPMSATKGSLNTNQQIAPEPASFCTWLLLTGLGACFAHRRRNKSVRRQ